MAVGKSAIRQTIVSKMSVIRKIIRRIDMVSELNICNENSNKKYPFSIDLGNHTS